MVPYRINESLNWRLLRDLAEDPSGYDIREIIRELDRHGYLPVVNQQDLDRLQPVLERLGLQEWAGYSLNLKSVVGFGTDHENTSNQVYYGQQFKFLGDLAVDLSFRKIDWYKIPSSKWKTSAVLYGHDVYDDDSRRLGKDTWIARLSRAMPERPEGWHQYNEHNPRWRKWNLSSGAINYLSRRLEMEIEERSR